MAEHSSNSSLSHQQMQSGVAGNNGEIRYKKNSSCCTCSVGKPVCMLHQSWMHLQETLIEKDHSLNSMSDKINRLSVHEGENKRKDGVISSLREEIVQLQKELQEKKTRLTTVEDVVESKGNTLLQKEGTIHTLKENIESLKTKLSLSERTTSGLQVQLTQKTQALAKITDELREVKRGKRFVEDDLSSSLEGMKEKKATLASLNERVKRLKLLNEELKSKLEHKEYECSRLAEAERCHLQEIAQLKQKSNTVSTQLNNTRKLFSETSHTNDDLSAKVGHVQEKLDSLCHQLKSLVGLHTSTSTSPSTTNDVNSIVSSVSQLISGQLKVKQELAQSTQQLQETTQRFMALEGDMESVNSCLAALKLPFADTVPMDTMISGAIVMLNQSNIQTDVVCVMQTALNSLLTQLKDMHGTLQCVRVCVDRHREGESNDGEEETNEEEDNLEELVQRICQSAQDYKSKCAQFQERLSLTNEQHGGIMEQALVSLKRDNDKKMAEAVEEMRATERDNYLTLINETKQKLEADHAVIVENWKTKLAEAKDRSTLLEQQLQERDNQLKEALERIKSIEKSCYTIATERDNLKIKFEKLKKSLEDEHSVIEAHLKMKEQNLEQSVVEYKVQSQQHARTIVDLNQQLEQRTKECARQASVNGNLQSHVVSLTDELEKTQLLLTAKTEKTNGIIETLRRQLTLANEQSGKSRIEVMEAEETLEDARKSYQKKLDEIMRDHKNELEDLRENFSNQESAMSEVTHKLSETQGELRAQKQMVDQVKQEKESIINKLTKLRNRPADNGVQTETESNEEECESMGVVGKRCMGEQHTIVIRSQQHAIVDLRKKVNELLTNKPLVPSHQEALKELQMLRQTVAQMRAEEVIKQERAKYQDHEKKKEAGLSEFASKDSVSIHKLKDVEEALTQSEDSYRVLLESVCSKVMCPIPDALASAQPMAKANKLAREHIVRDREEFIKGPLVKAIRGLRRGQQVKAGPEDVVVTQTPDSPPETPDLTEYGVYPTKEIEEIDKQKRLFQAITKRQEFRQTQQDILTRKSSHSCLLTPEDAQKMVTTAEKEYIEKLKKKDKEISKLRKDLQKSQQQGDAMASRLKLSVR